MERLRSIRQRGNGDTRSWSTCTRCRRHLGADASTAFRGSMSSVRLESIRVVYSVLPALARCPRNDNSPWRGWEVVGGSADCKPRARANCAERIGR